MTSSTSARVEGDYNELTNRELRQSYEATFGIQGGMIFDLSREQLIEALQDPSKHVSPRKQKQVAYNRTTRRYEEVNPETVADGTRVITLYWSNTTQRWMIVPK